MPECCNYENLLFVTRRKIQLILSSIRFKSNYEDDFEDDALLFNNNNQSANNSNGNGNGNNNSNSPIPQQQNGTFIYTNINTNYQFKLLIDSFNKKQRLNDSYRHSLLIFC